MKWKKDEAQNRKIETLVSEVRSAASESTEALWNAFLEIGDLDMVRAMEKALRLLVSHGDYIGAMKMLEGIYALVEIAPSEDFTLTVNSTLPCTDVHGGIIWPKSEDFIL